MQHIILFSIYLLVHLSFLPAATSQQNPDWKPYHSVSGDFLISFPELPLLSTEEIHFDGFNSVSHFYQHKYPQSTNTSYSLRYLDYPPELLHSDLDENISRTFLDEGMEGRARTLKGKLLDTKERNIRTYPGRQMEISYDKDRAIATFCTFLVDNRVYELKVVCRSGDRRNPDIERFFSSFDLLREARSAEPYRSLFAAQIPDMEIDTVITFSPETFEEQLTVIKHLHRVETEITRKFKLYGEEAQRVLYYAREGEEEVIKQIHIVYPPGYSW